MLRLNDHASHLLDAEKMLIEFHLDNEGSSADASYYLKKLDGVDKDKAAWVVRADYSDHCRTMEVEEACFEKTFTRSYTTACKWVNEPLQLPRNSIPIELG